MLLQSPVSAHGTLTLEIGGIFRLDAHCAAAAAVLSCEVVGDRWIQPHLAVRTWFVADRWTAWATQPRRFTPLWPASWVPSVDRSRSSKSAEVRRISDIYDERLGWVDADEALTVDGAVASGDVSGAWIAWSTAAERALADAFCLAGGPVPERGFCLGRVLARLVFQGLC